MKSGWGQYPLVVVDFFRIAFFLAAFTNTLECAPNTPQAAKLSCPGVYGKECTLDCQTAICRALGSFYRATHNTSQPWQHDNGWKGTTHTSCESMLLLGAKYCDWHGVQCCTADMIKEHHCSILHSVRALDLQVNGLNGSVNNPAFMRSLLQLHACGTTKLQLQGNDLSGNMSSSAWGELVNLTYLDLGNNWLSGTIPDVLQNLKHLTRLSLGTNQFSGTLPAWLGEVPSLETLNLGANTGNNDPDPSRGAGTRQGLTGTVPASLANLVNLTVLNLELNSLVGALPVHLCQPRGGLSKLRMLKLRGNQLSGNFQELLHCSSLAQLDVSSNEFTGPLVVPKWDTHEVWPNLAVLDASGNKFNGSIPVAIYELRVLEYLNLANNRFSGQIRRHITLTTYLKELNLEHNMLTGPIDPNLWLLPHLRLLDLSYNRLTGTIDPSIGRTFNLEELQLGNNNLSGPLPPQLGLLKKIDLVNLLRNDGLSCLHQPKHPIRIQTKLAKNHTAFPQCGDDQLLPCFLQFSNYTLPRTDASNMSCPLVLRQSYDDAQKVCMGEGSTQLGKQAHNVADGMADEQVWKLEPGYYQYRGCRCLPGFQENWARNNTLLVCTPLPDDKDGWLPRLIQASSAAGALFLAAVALLVWLRVAVQLKPRWQREKELANNRKKGMPSGGPASIVVTDIEKYSELMQSNAPLATKALGIHNSILRRAAAAHAGNVVEQEGDSWSVAFHTPTDAVAFCLQVQQALHRVNWPRDLGASKSNMSHMTTGVLGSIAATTAAAAAGGGADGKHSPYSFAGLTAAGKAVADASLPVIQLPGNLAWQQQQQAAAAKSVAGNPGWVRVPDGLWHMQQTVAAAAEAPLPGRSNSSSSSSTGTPDLTVHAAARAPGSSAGSSAHSFCMTQSNQFCRVSSFLSKVPDQGTPDPHPPAAAAAATAPWHSGSSSGRIKRIISNSLQRTSRFWSIIGFSAAAAAAPAADGRGGSSSSVGQALGDDCMRGLRVRMGVASGYVPVDTNIARCALLEVAKGVSDLAHGGQVLLDAVTFAGIRDRLTELGGVDHRGYSDITLAAAARAAMKQHTSGSLCRIWRRLSCCLNLGHYCEQQAQSHDNDALLLDMGEYHLSNLASTIPAAAAAAAVKGTSSPSASLPLLEVGIDAAVALAAAAAAGEQASSSSSSGIESQLLQVYSILPRCFAGRAKQWGSQLAVKDGMQQTGLGYFNAPGTEVADLQPARISEPFSTTSTPNSSAAAAAASAGSLFRRAPLPYVTMMFVAVDGGRSRLHRKHEVARIVHNTISRLMQALLLAYAGPAGDHLPGMCYLCRAQEGELKYMLAFREPAQAAEWALSLQEIMQYIPWPQSVLNAFSSNTPTSPTAAAAAFRRSSSGGSSSGSRTGYPLLNISFAEGQPNSVAPDHLGRADYHGPSVNLAARMLAAAAAGGGGRVVTSVEMAQSIFSTWCYQAALKQQQQQQLTCVATATDAEAGSTAATVPEQQQQQQQQHTSIDSSSPGMSNATSGDATPHHQPQHYTSGNPNSPGIGNDTSADATPQQQQQQLFTDGDWGGTTNDQAYLPKHSHRLIHVSGWHIGTYQFKGCGTFDMVTFTTNTHRQQNLGLDLHIIVPGSQDQLILSPEIYRHVLNPDVVSNTQPAAENAAIYGPGGSPHFHLNDQQIQGCIKYPLPPPPAAAAAANSQPPKGSKAVLLLPRAGPVVGLQNCPVMVPDLLPSLCKAWDKAAQ